MFEAFRDPAARQRIPSPVSAQTFASAKLDWDERLGDGHREWWRLFRDLLALRRRHVTPLLDPPDNPRRSDLQIANPALGNPRRSDLQIANPSELQMLNERTFRVTWHLAHGTRYSLLANLSDAALQDVAPPAGACIYVSPDGPAPVPGATHTLGPWCVEFRCEPAGADTGAQP
jgi:1,4-alpha-glucan branching enzyme